jgi:hypothetical protein
MYIISEGGRGIDNIFFSYFQLMQNLENHPKEQVISALKEWASPILIAIVGMLLWRDVTEMRADIKLLLTQQSADRVKIEQLEDDVKNFTLQKLALMVHQGNLFKNNPCQNANLRFIKEMRSSI